MGTDISKEFEIMKLDEEGNTRWSQLPTLFLWMTKDRLNFVDNVRLAAVCKDWNLASQSYRSKPQECLAPFLMHQIPDSAGRIFVNVSTMKDNLVFDLPEFHDGTSLHFSRRGWLLLGKSCDLGPGHTPQRSVVLLHLQTNAKIIMPTLDEDMRGICASFSSTDDGTPCCVVFAKCVEAQITLYVADVGDEKWIKYSYGNERGIGITASVVRGSEVYCLDKLGGLFIFHITNLEWREITGNTKQCSVMEGKHCCTMECEQRKHCFMMESEQGAILKVDECGNSKTFSFFKLNDRQSGWEELSENDAMGRSWFLSSTFDPDSHFTVMEAARAKKIYQLSSYCGARHDSKIIIGTYICFSDLINRLSVTYELQERGQWVDLGRIDKLPPSCVLYFPSPQF